MDLREFQIRKLPLDLSSDVFASFNCSCTGLSATIPSTPEKRKFITQSLGMCRQPIERNLETDLRFRKIEACVEILFQLIHFLKIFR